MDEQNLPPSQPQNQNNPDKNQIAPNETKTTTYRLARLAMRANWVVRAAEFIDQASQLKEARDAELALAEAEGRKPKSLIQFIKDKVSGQVKQDLDALANQGESPGKYGKLIEDFIKEEKERSLKEQPHYRIVAKEAQQLSSLEHRLEKVEREIEQHERENRFFTLNSGSSESAKVPKELFDKKSQLEHKVSGLLKQQSNIDRQYADSFAQYHSDPKVKAAVNRLLGKAEREAAEFEKNYLQGSVEQKHSYLVTRAVKELGKDYFDPEQHPDRVTRLVKFIGERLYSDGHEVEEIRKSYAQNPFTPNIPPDHKWIIRQTEELGKSSELNRVRVEVLEWKIKNNPEALKVVENTVKTFDHRNPSEFSQAQAWIARDNAIAAAKTPEQRYFEAKQVYDRYIADFLEGKDTKLYTKEEYQVEFIRQTRLGIAQKRLHEMDVDIAAKLRIAGHSEKDIAKAVQEASMFRSTNDYGEVILNNAKEHLLSAEGQAEQRRVELLRAAHEHLSKETRLDRLTLNSKEPVYSVPRTKLDFNNSIPQDYYDTPKSKDVEIGR
ncbi:MAG: hypothetical protein KME49_22620 [Brasilonema octagenarum HA4186-MV1]|jgi:hypothetical protein|nr:hypothetical protein [Brasilonema octagenarum HA4186-MV1]